MIVVHRIVRQLTYSAGTMGEGYFIDRCDTKEHNKGPKKKETWVFLLTMMSQIDNGEHQIAENVGYFLGRSYLGLGKRTPSRSQTDMGPHGC